MKPGEPNHPVKDDFVVIMIFGGYSHITPNSRGNHNFCFARRANHWSQLVTNGLEGPSFRVSLKYLARIRAWDRNNGDLAI